MIGSESNTLKITFTKETRPD